MSLLDRLPSRLQRYVLLSDAVARLGPAWLLFRIQYWLERKLGLLERRMPAGDWPPLVPEAPESTIVDTEALRVWLHAHCTDDRIDRLRLHAVNVAARRFDVFGSVVEMADWHHDARDGHHYDGDVHWSRVPTPVGADIKFVWEPSRFGWIFDLVRLHLIDPDSGADTIFWEAFEEWCEQNPPNLGVNWSCGQEASIRLMAVVIAASGMRDTATPERTQKVQRLAWVTAARVEANIAYARSQRNNHHASEAVGLLTTALLFPGHPATDRWRKLGERHLKEVCETLVFADGGTSQYSTNYHRVFVHNFVWGVQCFRSRGLAAPRWLNRAVYRTGRVLDVLTDTASGSGPFFGHDDGARLLPLSATPHRNLSQDRDLVNSTLGETGLSGEAVHWFVPPIGTREAPSGPRHPVFASSFEDFGIHVLVSNDVRAFVRCGTYRFRPSQDDLLHCDVWVNGQNILPDSGTASYQPSNGVARTLDGAEDHNGPRHASGPMLRRASRFLWARWPRESRSATHVVDDIVCGSFVVSSSGGLLHRTVEVRPNGVTITDDSTPTSAMVTRWFIDDTSTSATKWLFTSAPALEVASVTSSGYGRTSPCQRWEVRQVGPIVSSVLPDR